MPGCLSTLNLRDRNLSSNNDVHKFVVAKGEDHENFFALDLSFNKFQNFPKDVCSLGLKIETLSLACQSDGLKDIPEEIEKIESLQKLDVFKNGISTLPQTFANLRALSELDLSRNEFTSFPKQICGLTTLKKLYLRNNQITVIPDEIETLQNLVDLNCDNNLISEISASLYKLKELQTLSLRGNKVERLPEYNLSKRPNPENNAFNKNDSLCLNLRVLDISRNLFKNFPLCVAVFAKIEILHINDNNIARNLWKLTKHRHIEVYKRQFIQLNNNNVLESLVAFDLMQSKNTSADFNLVEKRVIIDIGGGEVKKGIERFQEDHSIKRKGIINEEPKKDSAYGSGCDVFQTLTDEKLYFLSGCLESEDCLGLGLGLNFSAKAVSFIEKQFPDDKRRVLFKILEKWRDNLNIEKEEEAVEKLKTVLCNIGKRSLWHMLR